MNKVKNQVLRFSNLYKATNKCRRNVRWKDSVAHFSNRSLSSIYKLKQRFINGTYNISPYSIFTIHEPKTRLITSTRFVDRVFQRSLCDTYLTKEISKCFIPQNFACQKDKGTDRAREYLNFIMKCFYKENRLKGYFLKIDIKDYFGSTDHEIAYKQVKNRVRDKWSCEEVKRIIFSFDKGIGLGSQVSQLIQLSVLDSVDHYIIENLKIKCYVRYMDDFIIIHHSKEYLIQCLKKIRRKLEKLKLNISKKKTKIIKINQPIKFLGFTFKLHETGKITWRLPKENFKKEKRKLLKLSKRVSLSDFNACYQSWRSHANKTDSRGRILKMDKYKGEIVMRVYTEQETNERKTEELNLKAEFVGETNDYAVKVNRLIRERYSLSDELAILRKALAKLGINDTQLDEYNAFVETCKEKAKEEDMKR